MVKRFIIFITFVLLSHPALGWNAKVVSVEDGDTFTVLSGGNKLKIRIFGVDCLENGSALGLKAKQFTHYKLNGKKVELTPVDVDRYGRIVAWVSIDGVNFNKLLIEKGLAYHYTKYSNDVVLKEAEKNAKKNQLGVWQQRSSKPQYLVTQPSAKPIQAVTQTGTVYHGNRKSRKFHRPSCRHYNCKNCTAVFNSRDEAIRAGYVPAGCCRP